MKVETEPILRGRLWLPRYAISTLWTP